MIIIDNTSLITDYSGEPPILTYSNTVTTVIRQTPTTPRIITRVFCCQSCDCCGCCNCCNCNCGCTE